MYSTSPAEKVSGCNSKSRAGAVVETLWTPRMALRTKHGNLCLLEFSYLAPSQPVHRSPPTFPATHSSLPIGLEEAHLWGCALRIKHSKTIGSQLPNMFRNSPRFVEFIFLPFPTHELTMKKYPMSGCILHCSQMEVSETSDVVLWHFFRKLLEIANGLCYKQEQHLRVW